MINRGPHEDDDFFVATRTLTAVVIEYLPGAIQLIIPQLANEFANKFVQTKDFEIPEEIYYIHQPN
jgi:hypothetical protein